MTIEINRESPAYKALMSVPQEALADCIWQLVYDNSQAVFSGAITKLAERRDFCRALSMSMPALDTSVPIWR